MMLLPAVGQPHSQASSQPSFPPTLLPFSFFPSFLLLSKPIPAAKETGIRIPSCNPFLLNSPYNRCDCYILSTEQRSVYCASPSISSMVAWAFTAASSGVFSPVITSLNASEIASEISGHSGSGPLAYA